MPEPALLSSAPHNCAQRNRITAPQTRCALAVCLLVLMLDGGCSSTRLQSATSPVSLPAPTAWYESEIRAFEESDAQSPPPPNPVLFIGSSSIRLWSTLAQDMSPMPVLNRGVGGSKTGEVLSVFDRIVKPCNPGVIVYYCGDNDLATDNTDSWAAAEGFIEFDRKARKEWPNVTVFYIPIKASVARWNNWPAMKRANEIVQAYCQHTHNAVYLDTVTPTLGSDGKPDRSNFREDGLHLSAKGYAIWTGVVRGPVLEKWKANTPPLTPAPSR